MLTNPETGRPIPAAEMVDLAKVGNIDAISGGCAVAGPTLEGSGRAQHPSIAAEQKQVFLPAKEDTYGNIEGLMQNFKLVMLRPRGAGAEGGGLLPSGREPMGSWGSTW